MWSLLLLVRLSTAFWPSATEPVIQPSFQIMVIVPDVPPTVRMAKVISLATLTEKVALLVIYALSPATGTACVLQLFAFSQSPPAPVQMQVAAKLVWARKRPSKSTPDFARPLNDRVVFIGGFLLFWFFSLLAWLLASALARACGCRRGRRRKISGQ